MIVEQTTSWRQLGMLVAATLAAVLGGCSAPQSPRPPAVTVPTTAPKAVVMTEQGLQVHRSLIVIDGHNDLPWQIRTKAASSFDTMDLLRRQESVQTDIPRLRQGGVGAQYWVIYVPPETEKEGGAANMALEQFDLIDRMIARYSDVFELARTAADVERIHEHRKIAALIGIEGGHTIENSLDNLSLFYRRGARYMGLTHSETTDWADSATDEPRHGGLSAFGERVVREMNRLGMLVDLAHVSADAMRDALRISKAPVIVSHASASTIAAHPRNVPDDVLRMIAANGGVVMVTFFPGYSHPQGARAMAGYFEQERALKEKYPDPEEFKKAWQSYRSANPIPKGDVGMVVDHIDYIVRVAGIDHVGLGSDYDGVGQMPFQLEDVSGYPYITQELLNRGYSVSDIRKIMGGNSLRVLRRAEEVARQ
jgi:membrane dipeptidase